MKQSLGKKPRARSAGISLHDATFLVIDLETTGASPTSGAQITEIGAVKIRGGVVLEEFSTFVNPLAPIPFYITQLTGITDEMLASAPIIDEAFPELLTFIENEVSPSDEITLVAHNAPFDIGFLKAASQELEIPWPSYHILDTVTLARRTVGKDEVPNYKLGTLSQYFETEVQPTHRALDDARTTVEILHRLIERLGSFEVETTKALRNFLAKPSPITK
jgi:DNA polymerase III epsilon subunit family exonuclease